MNIYELTTDAALESLRSNTNGLSAAEAARRLAEFGPNRIERPARVSIALRLLREFTHFFAVILWLAALLALVADVSQPGQGMRTLALAIVAVIVVNGTFSFWQEYRAEEAFLALQQLLPAEVTTVRDGVAARLPAEQLVPGDVVALEAGDSIPADCRIIQSFTLTINNATVTGEAHPVSRDALPSTETDLLHSRNGLLAGTSIASGSARGLVVATGMRTEFGQIARLAQVTEEAPSPLQRELVDAQSRHRGVGGHSRDPGFRDW